MEGRLRSDQRGKSSNTYKESMRNLVLRILLDGPMHGYEIMKKIKQVTRNRWKPAAGTLYPLLDQLEEEGYIEVYSMAVSNVRGGRRIVYRLTEKGVREAARVIRGMAQYKFDIVMFYLVDGAIALKKQGFTIEYEEICGLIRQGYRRLGEAIGDKCRL